MRTRDEVASEIGRILGCFSSDALAVAFVAPEGSVMETNPAFCTLVGRAREELAGTAFLDLLDPADRGAFDEYLERLPAGNVPLLETSGRFLRGDGSAVWVQSHVTAMADEGGEPEYLIALVQDISRLRSAEEQNAQLFGFPLALVFIAGLDGFFKRVGAGYERLLGWSEEELLSRPFFEFVHPDDVGLLGASMQEVAAGRTEVINQEIRALCKDGSYRWLMGNYRPVLHEGLMYGMAVDITERRRSEEALEESERRTRRILDTAYEAFISIDADGSIVDWNAEAERLFGWSREEALGRVLADTIVPGRYRDSHVRGLEHYRATGEGPVLGKRLEMAGLRRDGSEFPVELTISAMPVDHSVVFNAFLRDVTERKRAEEALTAVNAEAQAAREEAERANRAKSEFLSRMSHELRTPLNAVLGFAQLLDNAGLAEQHADSVDQILRAGRHLLQLIDEVLDVARIEQGQLSLSIEPVRIAEIVRGAVDLVRPLAAAANIQTWVEASHLDRYVLADRQRLKQVLMNLLSNAVKYNEEGGTVTVSCAETPEGSLRISVTDTGRGIPEEMMDRLFLPFERLGAERTPVEGTGIGLSICRRLVELMAGTIGAESEIDRGSTFWVELQLAEAPDERLDEEVAQLDLGVPVAGEERVVLYVEDNLSNLRLVERILAQRPATRLIAAMQGSLALDLAREHHPHLILLDVHLPDMGGDEVLARLRDHPETRDVPVVAVSAEATPSKIQRFLDAGARAYLTKPLDIRQFLEVVDGLLAEERE